MEEKALRLCRDCGMVALTIDDLDLFRTNSKSKHGKDNHCKQCQRKENRQYWTSENGRNKRLSKYGITTEDYNFMFEAQGGRCKICNIHVSEMKDEKKFLSVDHCHSTNKVRGLLCDSCNLGLGKFYDNISYLKNAISYLEENI